MSLNGGYINSICLVSILKSPVGYVTGNLTIAGESFAQGGYLTFLHLIILVMCFLVGGVISGLVIKGQNFKIDRRYSASLIFQSLSIISALILLLHGYHEASYLLALTMGMQNAMTTHYGTALIRTTHMTGTTTDLGILISRWIKGSPVEFWKMRLYISLIVGFSLGAILGVFAYQAFSAYALIACVVFYFFMMSWRFF